MGKSFKQAYARKIYNDYDSKAYSHKALKVTAVDQSGLICRTPSRNDYCKFFYRPKLLKCTQDPQSVRLAVIDKCASYESTNIVDICRLHFTDDNVFGVPYFPVPNFPALQLGAAFSSLAFSAFP